MENPNEFLNKLFEVEITTHIMHLQTTDYNDHLVLGDFYEAMLGFADCFAEQYQGATGEVITNIGSINIREGAQPNTYIKDFMLDLQSAHENCEHTSVKLVIEEMMSLVNKTLFLLKLK